MEARYRRVWAEFEARRSRGEPFAALVKRASSGELVALLAVAGTRDVLAANVIATELLNRERRAPFLGAFLVSVTVVVAIYVLDFVYTGTPLILDSGPRARILVALSAAIAGASAVLYLMWRGFFPGLRALFLRDRDY